MLYVQMHMLKYSHITHRDNKIHSLKTQFQSFRYNSVTKKLLSAQVQ